MKGIKIIYWISTGLLTLLMCFSASMYFIYYEDVTGFFEHLAFPTWMIYPLGVAKVLGLIAIWTRLSEWLKEWAYAGFFFDVVLAFTAHLMAGDGVTPLSLIGIVLVLVSYFSEKQLRKSRA